MKEFKITNYDKFKCTADKCKYTCCAGWDISVDTPTYEKWNSLKDKKYTQNLSKVDCGFIINKPIENECPFLHKDGLCEIVKIHGEDYLSNTCHTFPRMTYTNNDSKELTLNSACPEVVELIASCDNYITLNDANEELTIRNTLINIIKNDSISINNRLLASFQFLLELEEGNSNTILNNYNKNNYIIEISDVYSKLPRDLNDSMEEVCNLFLDLIENYKLVPVLGSRLLHISNFIEELYFDDMVEEWDTFKTKFDKFNLFITNVIISKIYSSCNTEDLTEITLNYQGIIIEYLLTQFNIYIYYLKNNKQDINLDDIKESIMIFSRVVGNNLDAINEFIVDGFEKEILDLGYIQYILI